MHTHNIDFYEEMMIKYALYLFFWFVVHGLYSKFDINVSKLYAQTEILLFIIICIV